MVWNSHYKSCNKYNNSSVSNNTGIFYTLKNKEEKQSDN